MMTQTGFSNVITKTGFNNVVSKKKKFNNAEGDTTGTTGTTATTPDTVVSEGYMANFKMYWHQYAIGAVIGALVLYMLVKYKKVSI